ncbi:MAG: ATP-binding protein [Actinomycetota bacterium]
MPAGNAAYGLWAEVARARRLAETGARQQEAVAELGNLALSRVDLDVLMASAVRAVTRCLRTEYASVLELRPGGEELLVRAGQGWRDEVVGATTVPTGSGSHAGYALEVGEPVVFDDAGLETRFSLPPLLAEHAVVSGAAVIISLEGEPFGVLSTHAVSRRAFSAEEVHFLQSVANVVAMAIVRERKDSLQEHVGRQDRLAAIGQFAAGMAHDFNNLVTVIRLHAELLGRRPGLDADTLREVAQIREQAEQAAAMVWQVLEFAHRDPITRAVVDLDPFCRELLPVLRRLCPPAVDVRLGTDGGDHRVLGDTGRLQQVLLNLATNARDAMPDGGRLDLTLSRVEVEPGPATPLPGMTLGPWVRVGVSDTGSGIPPEAVSRVFEPFFSTKEPGRGTGLGLAQVYGLVLQHEGRVDLQTVVGRGTTVTVWLPAAPDPPPRRPPPGG